MEISLLACSIYSMYSPDRRERERERRGLKLPRRNGERRSRGPLELFGSTLATPLLLETPRDERVPRRRGVRPSTNLGWISTRRAIQNQTRWNNRYTSVICSNKTFHLWFLALIFLLNLKPPIDPPPTTQINYCRVSNFTPSRLFLSSGRRERVRDPSLPPLSPRKLLLVIEFPSNPLRGHVLLHFAKLEQHRISLSRSFSSSIRDIVRLSRIRLVRPRMLLLIHVKFQISLICCPNRVLFVIGESIQSHRVIIIVLSITFSRETIFIQIVFPSRLN